MKFQTNYTMSEHPGEVFTEKSMTVPDMAMSISEMFTRLKQGLPIKKVAVAYSNDLDSDEPLPVNLDLVDIDNLNRKAKEVISNAKARIMKAKEEKKTNPPVPPNIDEQEPVNENLVD